MTTLRNLFDNLNPIIEGASIKFAHYLDIYEILFAKLYYLSCPVSLLEIGIERGGSLSLWHKYFKGPKKIIGVDINPNCSKWARPGIDIYIGDQTDSVFMSSIANLGPYDIIIDDGAHTPAAHLNSLNCLFGSLKEGGLYIIEDTQTAYNESFTQGQKSIVDFCKQLADYPTQKPNFNVESVMFLNRMIVITKNTVITEKIFSPGFNSIQP